ncbi:MAG: diguanylate cyclase (GGDEF)-like protein [Paracoccaceae bacterium]|jgi:diguanylate cyclase (GGDEF)-like protein
MHLKAKVVAGVLSMLAAATLVACALVFAVNSSIDSVLNLFQQAQLLGLIAIAIAMVMVSVSIITRQLSNPITLLVAFIDSLSRGRGEETIPYLTNEDAIGDLARAIESMSRRFQQELSIIIEAGRSAKRELMASNYRLEETSKGLAQSRAGFEESSRRVGELEIIDRSTGLHNRRHFDHAYEYEMKRLQRSARALSIAVFELACWRDIKAALGQPAADSVLIKIADTIMATVRTTDFVARYGDSSVALLLPETQAKHAAKLTDNIYTLMESADWLLPSGSFEIVIAAGGGCYRCDNVRRGPLSLSA